MARPKKHIVEKLSARFPSVRCTVEDLATLKSNASKAGISIGLYLRQLSTKGYVEKMNDNQPVPFEEALIHRFKTDVGHQINQMAKAANQTKALPNNLEKSLMRLEYFIDHIRFSVKVVDDYSAQRKSSARHPSNIFTFDFANQLIKVGTNLFQLVTIAEKNGDSKLDDLVRCHGKLTPLLDRIISSAN